jgi:hypothetical protein|tara:strand:+ start:393 stop:1022 length:630 start_codon:yes stop_codon:yes gene_type:complete
MAVYTPSYPLTLPTATGITTQNFSLLRVVAVTESPFTKQEQVYEHEGSQWKATVTLPPMLKTNASIWLAFLMSLRGQRGTFKLGDQDRKTIQGTATSTILVNGADQVGNSINLDGFTPSRANVFKAGDYIQINSYLYMISADASANASGEATVYVEPSLRSAIETINDGTTVIYTNTTTIMRLDTNELEWQTDNVSKYGISFSCSESLS